MYEVEILWIQTPQKDLKSFLKIRSWLEQEVKIEVTDDCRSLLSNLSHVLVCLHHSLDLACQGSVLLAHAASDRSSTDERCVNGSLGF